MRTIQHPVVIGSGSWGTALAHLLAHSGHTVRILAIEEDVVASINASHENVRYLSGARLHDRVSATLDPEVLREADLAVLAVPCQVLRAALRDYRDLLSPDIVAVNAAKGIELESLHTPCDIVRTEIPSLAKRYAALSGPSFAREVMENKPTAVVLGCADEALGAYLRTVFATAWFRSYSSTDVLGVELGGAVKNVMAIAAGLADGLGYGHNARAALITRGLVELGRLGVALGARAETLGGLSGLGDLVLTCTGDLSRNRTTGLRLGAGESLVHIVATLGSVAEGVKTTASLHTLAEQHGVDMPIVDAVHGILYENREPVEAVRKLFERELKVE